MLRLFIVLSASLLAFSCSDLEPVSDASSPAPAPATQASAPANTSTGEGISAQGLKLDLPEGWAEVNPDSAMRLFQLSIPGSGGEARLAAFHFGVGGGGGVEANIGRWIGQLADATEPTRESFSAGELAISWVESSGTLKKSGIGSFPTEDMPGYALIGAVVEGSGGPWYLRLVGPAATVLEQRTAFKAMLEGARLE